MKKFIDKKTFFESLIPLFLIVLVQIFCYGTPKIFAELGWYFKVFDFTTKFDIATPFIPEAILIYLGCYVFWFLGVFIAFKVKNKKTAYDAVSSLIICHFICFIIYILMPTTTHIRPDLTLYEGNNFWINLCKITFATDTPFNLFPSMHVTVTWFCYIAIRRNKDISLGYRLFTLIFSFMIFASILLTKQHYVWDILPSIILCEVVYFIVRKTSISDKFKTFCFKINKKLKFDRHINS